MAQHWNADLQRWLDAGLIETGQAERIRHFEEARQPGGLRWPVLLALAFGGLMLGAGVLLFVSAHWDELSPAQRYALVLSMVAVFHVAGAFASDRWPDLAVSLHAVGTLSLGAGIAISGQIFNMAEHWPAAILMWAAGAAIAWGLLRHWTQALLTALLVPAWLGGEWVVAYPRLTLLPAGLLVLAFTYLSAASPRRTPERIALAWAGGLALLPLALCTVVAAVEYREKPAEWPLLIAFSTGAVLLAVWLRRKESWTNALAALWTLVFTVFCWQRAELAAYVWAAAGSAGTVAWGLRDSRTERVNLGVAAFAITVLVFYFSSVMDKLGRSASLIALGLLFLGGGWLLERTRRRLVVRAKGGGQ